MVSIIITTIIIKSVRPVLLRKWLYAYTRDQVEPQCMQGQQMHFFYIELVQAC